MNTIRFTFNVPQVPAATQALAVIDILSGADGTTRGADKIARLRRNTRMFREGLKMMVGGDGSTQLRN